MLQIRESTPPVDVLSEARWSIEIKRWLGAPEYRVTAPDGNCIAAFTDLGELRGFAQMLREDIESGRTLPQVTREAYGQIIEAIDGIEA